MGNSLSYAYINIRILIITLGIVHVVNCACGTCNGVFSPWDQECNEAKNAAQCYAFNTHAGDKCDWIHSYCTKTSGSPDTGITCHHISKRFCEDVHHKPQCEWMDRSTTKHNNLQVDHKEAKQWGKHLSYEQLVSPFDDSHDTNPQDPAPPLAKYKIPLYRMRQYIDQGFPVGPRTELQTEKFPDGVYSFVVLNNYQNTMMLVWWPLNTLPTYGHTSLLTDEQYIKYKNGELTIKYAGEIIIEGGSLRVWDAKSGHFMPDQNKYIVFGKHWGLPLDKFIDLNERMHSAARGQLFNILEYNDVVDELGVEYDPFDYNYFTLKIYDYNSYYLLAIIFIGFCYIFSVVSLCFVVVTSDWTEKQIVSINEPNVDLYIMP